MCIRIWLYKLRITFRSLSDVSYSDECRTKKAFQYVKKCCRFFVLYKKNYRPITVLPSVFKIFERLLARQMLPFVSKFLSPKICGYRQGYNAQHVLIKLVETCKKTLDNKGFVGVVFMDLSKAFDCLNHELLLAKLNAYGFSTNAIRMMCSYLTGRRQSQSKWLFQLVERSEAGCPSRTNPGASLVQYIY